MSKSKNAFQVIEPAGFQRDQGAPEECPQSQDFRPADGRPAEVRCLAHDVGELSLAVGELDAQLRQIIRVNQALEADLARSRRERDSLAGKVHSLSHALATSEQRVLEIVQVLDRFRAERDGASQEAVCLDAQFSRAMKVIDELRTELGDAVSQRDSLKVELAESRRALEEIRKSILDASRE